MVSARTVPVPVAASADTTLIDAHDYDAAWQAYQAAAGESPHALALNRAVDAVTPVIAVAVLDRVYRRLLVLADGVPVSDSDAARRAEVGLRIAAVKARGLAREIAGEAA